MGLFEVKGIRNIFVLQYVGIQCMNSGPWVKSEDPAAVIGW